MDKLTELKLKQERLAELQQEVEALEKSKDIQNELAFREDLEKLLTKYGKTMDDLVPASASQGSAAAGRQRRRATRRDA